MNRFSPEAGGNAAVCSRHYWSPRVFLRLFGLLLTAVYLSLASQIDLLIGPDGLLPADLFFRRVQEAGVGSWDQFPSVFRFGSEPWFLVGAMWVGAACGVFLLAGRFQRAALAVHFVIYVSLVTAGQRFFTFQWDNLILETTVLAFLLPEIRDRREAHWLAVFLFRFLLFRLLFESGVSKLHHGFSSWHRWIAMDFYYETAPIPAPLGYWFHQLPHTFHVGEQAMTYFVELAVPFLLFWPAPARRFAFVINLGLQGVIAATANYGSFNYLSAMIGLLVLDDRDWRWLAGLLRKIRPGLTALWLHAPREILKTSARARLLAYAAGLPLLVCGAVSALDYVSPGGPWTALSRRIDDRLEPFRAVNTYHLFADVTLTRPTTEIEWRDAAGLLHPLPFRDQATRPDWAPELLAPHHPRVAFSHWFLALGSHKPVAEPWFAFLLEKICLEPQRVSGLFDPAAVPPVPPQALQVRVWDYRMTSIEVLRETGNYWNRSALGEPMEIPCGFFRSDRWRKERG